MTQTKTGMMVTMDRFEGRCWLDWQANSSAIFGGFEVSVVITPVESAWDAHGQLISDGDDREMFTFLCDMDPVFTLRFQDGSTIQVTLTPAGDQRFTLSEYARSAGIPAVASISSRKPARHQPGAHQSGAPQGPGCHRGHRER